MILKLNSFKDVFFCTGARNQDLLKVFSDHEIKFEYDERMASFKALGLTKMTQAPVAVCTTSGTAVAQCIPAMLEAIYSKLPFVLISGDRPKKLHGTGSPQTIDHESLTRSCRGSYLELTYPEFQNFELKNPIYPVHINVLVDDTVSHSETTRIHQDINSFATFMQNKKNPLFLFSHEEKSMRPFVSAFAKTGLPFYAESLSCGRDISTLKNERQLLRFWDEGIFDCIVRVGFTPLSKIWRLLEKRHLPVFSFDSRGLSGLSFGDVLPWSSEKLLSETSWWKHLPSSKTQIPSDNKLAVLIDKFPQSEITYFKRLQDVLKSQDIVYLGNSLVVRFFELVQDKEFEIYGNRGVNGIDGQLASAIGIALGTPRMVYCVLGDITTLYDLSSLGEMPSNLKLIIMNNKGGRIFDMLKLDKRIVMEHERDFKDLCQGFGRSYSTSLNDLESSQVIELSPDRLHTEEFLKEWNT